MGAWWLALIVGVAAGYSQIDITPLLTNERRTSGEVRIPEVRLTVDGKVGFPAQSVPMVVSTALPRSYVSTSLTSAVPSFAPARSLTLETNNTDIAFLSPSGFANGKLAYDTVQIGWLEADRHPFVMATGLDQSAIVPLYTEFVPQFEYRSRPSLVRPAAHIPVPPLLFRR